MFAAAVLVSILPSEACAWNIIIKERFLEKAVYLIGVHLHGEELNLPEMEYIAKG